VLNVDALFRDLDEIGLTPWKDTLAPLLAERMSDNAHGDIAQWKEIIRQLPATKHASATEDQIAVIISGSQIEPEEINHIRKLLQDLTPWRKGPFRIYGIDLPDEVLKEVYAENAMKIIPGIS
jgi:tRNA (mo5U34)-methyltransferase